MGQRRQLLHNLYPLLQSKFTISEEEVVWTSLIQLSLVAWQATVVIQKARCDREVGRARKDIRIRL